MRREIDEISRAMIPADSLDEWTETNAAEIHQRDLLEEDLSVLETLELADRAQPFGINLFPIDSRLGDPAIWVTSRDGRRMLTEYGVIRANNLITEARFSYWKRWIDVVTPVASTIISVIALLLAALALYLQISSDPIIVVPPPS